MLVANISRYSARSIIFILGGLVFIFALISGADIEKDGFMGILHNVPNALPWLCLLALGVLSLKYEMIGGAAVTIFGTWIIYFFNFSGPNFFITTFIVSLIFFLSGILLIISSLLRNRSIKFD
jgi:hypothetical protein